MALSNKQIRQNMRRKRAALTEAELEHSASRLAFLFTQQALFQKSKSIASFIAVNGEQSPHFIHQIAQQKSKQVYLPILKPFSSKLFFGSQEAPRRLNKFNIPEPDTIAHIAPWTFDIVLMPLTAFDKKGNRIGMGGGYYDHTFEFTKYCKKRPILIGVAHDFQKTAIIKSQPWDVPLDGILTENEFTLFT